MKFIQIVICLNFLLTFSIFLYIVNKEGKIAYRSEWNDPKTVKKVLIHLENPKSEKLPRPKAKMPSPFTVFKVMKRGGWNPIIDMIPGIP